MTKNLRQSLPLLNSLAVFEASARHSNLTRAAEELCISQPSVSRHVANLEAEIGVALFTRKSKKLALTGEGRALAEAVAFGFGHVSAIVEGLRRRRAERPFTIACGYDFAQLWLMKRFGALREISPDTQFRLITGLSGAGYDGPDVDLSVRKGTGHWPSMESIKLFDNVGFPVCAPSLLNREPRLATLRTPYEVLTAPLLHFEAGGVSSWTQWTQYFGLDECAGDSVGVFTSTTFLLTAALEGRGVALAWQNYWDAEIVAGRLVRLTDHVIRPKTGMYLVYPKGSESPLLNQIVLFLRSCVQPAASPIHGLSEAT